MNMVSHPSPALAQPGVVSLTTTGNITAALHRNRKLVMNATGAAKTFTLPAATGTGDTYRFYVGTVNTSNYVIATQTSEYFSGNIFTNSSGDSQSVQPWISLYATHNIKITLDGTTKGGVAIGDFVEVTDIAAATWSVTGMTTSSGTEASPFSTS